MTNVNLPKVEFANFYRTEGCYNLLNSSERSVQYVFKFPQLSQEQIKELGLQVSYLVSIENDYDYNPKTMTAFDLACELKEYYDGFLFSSNAKPIEKLCTYLSEIEDEQEKIRDKFQYEYALAKVEYWKNKANEAQATV